MNYNPEINVNVERMTDAKIVRRLVRNKRGQWTITVPVDLVRLMGANPGDRFEFDIKDRDTLIVRRAEDDR